jgi:2-polyprenyl-3-methyl-5-hydroxy-6-metoxy-1,4-benzoquinol methylase
MDFGSLSINWDTDIRAIRARKIAEKIAEKAQITKDMEALEFGCGTGLVGIELLPIIKALTMVDLNEGMIEVLTGKIKALKLNNIQAISMDILKNNKLAASKYDVIFTSMAMHHVIDIEGTINVLRDMLKPCGKLVIVDLNEEDGSFHSEEMGFNGYNGFNQFLLAKLLAKLELTNIDSETFYFDKKKLGQGFTPYSLFIMISQKAIEV